MQCIDRFLILGLLGVTLAGAAEPEEVFALTREANTLAVAVKVPAVELRIHSDRNATVARYGDVSPRQPAAWPDGRRRRRQMWWPVIDLMPDETMAAVVELADVAAGAQVSWNGWVRRVKEAAAPVMHFPAPRLLEWENSLWIDQDGPKLQRFYVRRPLAMPAGGTAQQVTLRLLAPDWSGRIEVIGRDAAGRDSVLAARRVEALPVTAPPPPRPAGQGLEQRRLQEALTAVIGHTLDSVVTDPRDPMRGGLYVFYDLDASTYRTSHWIWGWGPSVALLLDARQVPAVTARFAPDRLLAVAKEIGEVALRTVPTDPASPVRDIPASRWDRESILDFGHDYAITPCDAGFMAAWAWVRLGEATGDPKWQTACVALTVALDRLMKEYPVPPQNYWPDLGKWDLRVIDEAGFGVELFAEQYRVTGDARMRSLGRRYIEQHLAALGRPDGLWDRVHFFDGRPNRPTEMMTRGLGWPMEGLLAAHRLMPDEPRYLELANQLAGHFLKAQQPEGYWVHRFDQPVEVWGAGTKGTALWCWLFYELHRQTGNPQHLVAARRALGWLLDQQYFGPDPRARGGLVSVSPQSAVGIRPWFQVSSSYGAAFFGLALLEELKLQSAGQPAG